ncbi:efflux RND transporter periplasmic adaptor subunit [Corynebacterium timonense]|uniref:HlyD family secretion protein n=1 Tax=Corynebacterium timonense TaxID=441500 RepID=A0A1H1MPC5_9CORY|nr:HlyD family efflux transporter periplasmic adaptor subunit [Corynebacterium timonense]SDR88606.1 HlyD family secretion protein [Corynebacterium timonense]
MHPSVETLAVTRSRSVGAQGVKLRVKKACAAAVAATALFVAGCGVGGGDAADGLGAGDYTVAEVGNVTNSIVVNGNIAPIRSTSITSPLQSEVVQLAVAAGDRVEQGQFLAEMDTEAIERQLAEQRKQAEAAQAQAAQGYEQARAQLAAHTQQVQSGTHPAISAARAQAAEAAEADAAAGAPTQMILAANEQGQTVGIAPIEEDQAGQAQAGQAQAGQAQAQAALQAAQAQVAEESQQLQAQAESARQQAQAANNMGTDSSLEYQVQQSTIYAPMSGVVATVDVQVGDVPQGRILSIADDSRLLITSEVREADVANVKVGDAVRFTSTATGDKEYQGKVRRIAPVGSQGAANPEQQQNGGAGAKAGRGGVSFPIEIEVEGDKEGLLLGGSVRAEIITDETPEALMVPLDAIYDDNKILVLATGSGEEDGRQGTVEERTVTTGTANEVDIAVTGGDLEPGDIVINWPDRFRDRLGETVEITDPNFDPAQVDGGGEPDESGQAGDDNADQGA